MIALGFLGYFGSFAIYELDHSFYDRQKFDHLLSKSFGEFGIRDALTEDLFLIAYSYNFGIPRFYTKYFAGQRELSLDYDVRMDFAAAATSATPLIFDPVTRITFNNKKRDQELIIDGNIIANNPSLYATVYARHHKKMSNITVVSLGFRPILEDMSVNFTYMNPIEWVSRIDEIIFDAEVTSHDWLTSKITDYYRRYDYPAKVNPYDTTFEAVLMLEINGEKLVQDNKEDLEATLRKILDERYQP